jgi:integrase
MDTVGQVSGGVVSPIKRKSVGRLTAVQVRNLREPGRYADGDQLFLEVGKTGRRQWLFRYQSPAGRKRDMVIGSAETVPLADARAAAAEARALLARGIDPLDERHGKKQQARAADSARKAEREAERATLARVAREYHELISPKFRNRKHAQQWINSLEQHVPADVWKKPIAAIKAGELVDAVVAIQRKVPETGSRVGQRLAATFEHALLRELIKTNPMGGTARRVRELVGKRQKGAFAALPYQELPALMATLRTREGLAARALELAVLTAARTTEVLHAHWSEFDLDAGLWRVPGERMKGGEPHTVFLSEPAVELLRALPRVEDSPYLLPSPMKPERPLSNMAMLMALGRLGVRDRTTAHGLARVTFSTWANETTSFKPDVIEACLAHREADRVRAAYNRAGFEGDRRALLAAWARYIRPSVDEASNVIELRAAAA